MFLTRFLAGLFISFFLFSAFKFYGSDWGFFMHRRINRLAVFTLPVELIGFYKKNIEYITAHAVDPDMRRYVVPVEGYKHYIDLDRWNRGALPKGFLNARRMFTEAVIINGNNDTLRTFGKMVKKSGNWNVILKGENFYTFFEKDSIVLLKDDYHQFFRDHIYRSQYLEKWELDCDSIETFFRFHGFYLNCQQAMAIDTFVSHGVLPYHLVRMQRNLTEAMRLGNVQQILRLSADFGHYIGDAHVPLHTTSNYNGQETGQLGIHAFWETRLPELFADEEYDYFVGKAIYIEEPLNYYWNIIEQSHALVNDVLSIEKIISKDFPEDQQQCFIERGEGYIQTMACEEYARLYHKKLNGQVEDRLRAAIHVVGNAWYSAWVDAGQPDLDSLTDNRIKDKELKEEEQLIKAVRSGKILGRKHN